jgi:Ni/Co efflux regulator RcnB
MKKILIAVMAAAFAATTFSAIAQDKKKGPSAEECKKDPKTKGCPSAEKKK